MRVAASERGLVRLFAVDLPSEEIAAFRDPIPGEDAQPSPLQAALGVSFLDDDFIELFDIGEIDEIGLIGYMEQGLGIAAKDLIEDRLRLTNLKGHVLIVLSGAFGGFEQTLTPRAPLRWIGTYAEEGARISYETLPSQSAKGLTGTETNAPQPTPANPHKTLLLALLALPTIAILIAAIFLLGSR